MVGSEELWESWERVRDNEGCAGVDGISVHQFGKTAEKRLAALRERVSSGIYRALPLLKIVVQKRPGSAKMRRLLVPAVIDRVIQTAVARRLTQAYEEEFLDCSFAYRPGRGVDLAVARIKKYRDYGYEFVVDADIQSYFDQVELDTLLAKVEAREPERWVQGLVRQWVNGAYWDGSKVHAIRRGIAQGSPVSPVLANLYLEDLDRELAKSDCKLIRYSDDFVILAKSMERAEWALDKTAALLESVKLKLNREKTDITSFEVGFQFLGVYFHGADIWTPWKNDKPKGKVLFVAKPMPAEKLRRYQHAPAKGEMEEALLRAELPRLAPVAERRSRKVAYLYLTAQGAILRKAGDRFLVEKDGEILLDLPYHKLESVLVFGNIQVTTQALGELMDKGVQLALFSRTGDYRGSMMPARGKNVLLRLAQFDAFRDAERPLEAGRRIISAKTANGAAVLERLMQRDGGGMFPEFETAMRGLRGASEDALRAASVEQLMGIEGAAARAYFEALMGRFNKSELPWPGRKKHPSTDPLNAMLSLTYMVLMAEFESLLEGVGLDPYIGFLHQADYGRPSLALDLLEPFRHPAADRFVLAMANQRILEADDFETDERGVVLKSGPLKTFFEHFEKWMLAKASPAKPSLRERMRMEVEGFRAWVEKGRAWEPYRWDAAAEEGETCNMWSVTI